MSPGKLNVAVDRIELCLDGFALDDAQFVADRLRAALAARLEGATEPKGGNALEQATVAPPDRRRMCVDALAGQIVEAIDARCSELPWK